MNRRYIYSNDWKDKWNKLIILGREIVARLLKQFRIRSYRCTLPFICFGEDRRMSKNKRRAYLMGTYKKFFDYECMNPLCKNGLNPEVHHITPLQAGGVDAVCNYILLCQDCHDIKGLHSEWTKWEFKLTYWKCQAEINKYGRALDTLLYVKGGIKDSQTLQHRIDELKQGINIEMDENEALASTSIGNRGIIRGLSGL